MKLATVILLIASQAIGATYININTKAQQTNLPAYVKLPDGGVKYTQDIKDHAPNGWREMPKTAPVASVGSVIVAVEYVQDKDNPLAVEAKITEKATSVIAAEQAQAEQAAQTAADEREAARLLEREAITKAFPDEKQAEAIGALFDMMRPR